MIFGIDENKDTLEASYLLSLEKEKIIIENIDFNMINSSININGSYFIFEITEDEAINQINLDFNNKNFDWKVKFEGSQNQLEWFTILDNYRILSIESKLLRGKLVWPARRTSTEGIYKSYSFLRKKLSNNGLNQSII